LPGPLARTVILAPHGGGIEKGTSELCLAVAGYHPERLTPYDPAKSDEHRQELHEGDARRAHRGP
jgi:phage replication-related protein YjqB (UPF0714/DUF867 family)